MGSILLHQYEYGRRGHIENGFKSMVNRRIFSCYQGNLGAGQQQVSNIWSNIGCWNLCGWLYTIVELAPWDETSELLANRSDRPWDNPDRRASHADRCRQIAQEMLRNVFFDDLGMARKKK